ncbi:hypothetical protein KJ365_05900 [Glaciecola sp. XM2]|uniref:hypothetical protein n=1 Tax=Glaciecola sp. XM2 TaxID=1914931 RepID=UPI001BDE4D75|nr:hypothetical protein [Glaciecola sp. XM2]MBT1450409.1 hypothetical protein [Glaciecola sp. XM2]
MTIFKALSISVLALTTLISAPHASEGQEAQPTKKEVERIEVQGSRPKGYYLSEFRKNQTDFVRMFNDLVNDSEMEVVCESRAQTGSRVKKRVCEPRFISTLTFRETQRELAFSGDLSQAALIQQNPQLQKALIEEFAEFQKITAALLNEHAELAEKYTKMNQALSKVESFSKD